MGQTALSTRPAPALETAPFVEPSSAGSDHFLTVALALALAGAALQTTVHLLNAALGASPQLDVNAEGNAMTWASSVATFAAAFAAGLHATLLGKRRRTFILLAGVFAFFSLDDAILLHERLSERVLGLVGVSVSWDSVLWPALYLPAAGLAFLLLFAVARTAPARAGRFLVAGLVLLATAVAAEALSAPASTPETAAGWGHVLEGAYEEGAELAGWILIAAGLTVVTLAEAVRAEAFRRLSTAAQSIVK
jgi:hypothetical protein